MYFDRGRRLVTFFLSPESVPYRAAQTEDLRERLPLAPESAVRGARFIFILCAAALAFQ